MWKQTKNIVPFDGLYRDTGDIYLALPLSLRFYMRVSPGVK